VFGDLRDAQAGASTRHPRFSYKPLNSSRLRGVSHKPWMKTIVFDFMISPLRDLDAAPAKNRLVCATAY
jgi:hypothetical protein